jgi:hypothetical protein
MVNSNIFVTTKKWHQLHKRGADAISLFASAEYHTLGVWFQKAYSYGSKKAASLVRINAGLPTA